MVSGLAYLRPGFLYVQLKSGHVTESLYPKIFNHLTLPGVKSVTPVAVPKSIFLSFKIWKALALLRSRSWSSIYEKEGLSPFTTFSLSS